MSPRKNNRRFQSKSRQEPAKSSFQQKFYARVIDPIKNFFITLRELFLGRTDKQLAGDKPSYLGKKMLFLLFVFILFSFTLFAEMNADLFQGTILLTLLTFFTFNQPYIFGIAVSFTFIEFSLLISNDAIHKWFFERLYALKQLLLIAGLTAGNFFLVRYLLDQGVDLYAGLLILAMFWLIFQSIRIFNGARHGATKSEAKISERYSPLLYFIAVLTPFIILGVLTFLSWVFRYFIVIFTLDYIGHPDILQPDTALAIYGKEMGTIMPMIYTGLFFIFVLMIAQVFLSRKRGATKRAGAYDNFTFGLIAFVMFIYAIYNIALYLFLDDQFLQGFNTLLGSESHGNTAFFIEYMITIVFLIWLVIDLHKQFESGVLFFTKDGMVMFLMGTIFAQTTARLGITSGIAQVNSGLSNLIKYDYVVLPWVILIFLGVSIISYWIRPQEMSMFLHMSKSAVKEEDKGMENILRFLKREFIRRGEKYIISPDIIASLRKITAYPSGVLWSLIYRLDRQYIDVHLQEEKGENGEKIVYFDFLPITQRYQKSKAADKRAQAYLANYFVQSLQKKPRKRMSLTNKKLSSSKQSDVFIQSLSFNYAKKVQKQDEIKKNRVKSQEVFQDEWIKREMDHETKVLVYELIKKEYIRRMTRIADYPNEFRFRISDIAAEVEKATAVPVGRVFALLHSLAAEDWNFQLSADFIDADNPDDRLVEFLPIDDWELYDIQRQYRPESLREIHVLMQTWFDRNIHHHRKRLNKLPPLKYKDDDAEFERSYLSRWFANLAHYLARNFTERQSMRRVWERHQKLKQVFEDISGEVINYSERDYIYTLVRDEFLDRVKNVKKFADPAIAISEIGPKIAKKSKVPIGRVFTLLDDLGDKNPNIIIQDVKQGSVSIPKGEKSINFLPIDDFEIYYALKKYRPKQTTKVDLVMQRRFKQAIRYPRRRLGRVPPRVYSDKQVELERSYKSHWFNVLMHYLVDNYGQKEQERTSQLEYKKVKYLMQNIINGSRPAQA